MRRYVFIVLFLFVPLGFAAQTVIVPPHGGQAKAVVSTQAITLLRVGSDRIVEVTSYPESLHYKADDRLGTLYLDPKSFTDVDGTVSLFITTELGHQFLVELTPKAVPATTIDFILPQLETGNASFEKPNPYEQTLVHLMRGLHHHQAVEGFRFELASKKDKSYPWNESLILKRQFQLIGKHWVGEAIAITNGSGDTVTLGASDFYQAGVLAIRVLPQTLAPDATGLIHVIRERDLR